MITLFYTCVVKDRKPILTKEDKDFVKVIEDSAEYFSRMPGFLLHALSIMPNHVHMLFSLNELELDFDRKFRSFTTKEILRQNKTRPQPKQIDFSSSYSDRTSTVWRKRSYIITVRDMEGYYSRINYIKNNHLQDFWLDVAYDQSFDNIEFKPRIW